jgi:type I restriction enzyme, S subunit
MIEQNDLPEGWLSDRFKDVVVLRNEKTDEKSEKQDYLELEDIEQGTGRLLSVRSTEAVESAVVKFAKYDVLFGKLRPYLEKYWLAEFDGKCTGEILAFKAEDILPQFLKYCVASDDFIKLCVSMSYGAKMPRVNWPTQIAQINLPLPPSKEQTRIAKYLDRASVAIDRIIAIKQQQLEKLDTLGKSQISKVMVEGINPSVQRQTVDSTWFDEIPAHWTLRRLKDGMTLQTGITLGKEYHGELVECPYLRVANVQDGYLNLDDITTIFLPKKDIPRFLLRTGDVLMTEGGDLDKLGRGHVWRGEIEGCLHQNHVFAVRCNEKELLPEYLAFLTSSNHGRNYFEITGKRTTNLASTNSTKVGQFPVPLPPIDEQRDIIEYLNKELIKIGKIKNGVVRQIEVLQEYKKSLIHECVTGKRRITNADLKKVA